MARISEIAEAKGTQFRKVMAHRPEIGTAWSSLDELMRFSGVLPPLLKEEVRRSLAQESGCAFCASLGTPNAAEHDAQTRAAVRFALAAAHNPSGLSDDEFDALREHFNEKQIVELVAWVSFMYASEMLGALMRLSAATPEQYKGYELWLKTGYAKYERAKSAGAVNEH